MYIYIFVYKYTNKNVNNRISQVYCLEDINGYQSKKMAQQCCYIRRYYDILTRYAVYIYIYVYHHGEK